MREVFSLVGQNKSLICLIWGIWTVLGKNIIFRGKKKQAFFFFFCMPAGIMGTSNARNLLLFLVIRLVVIWNVEGWKEEKLGTRGGEGCLCFTPVAPAHRIFVNAFQSGYHCSLCQNHKAHYGAAEREHWGESLILYTQGCPGGSVVKNLPGKCRKYRFDPWVGKIPWRRKWQLTPIFLPGKSHGQRSLAGYSLWGHQESDTA